MEGRKFPAFPVCLQDFLKVVFQISPACVRLQLSDCQTFLRLPRRLPSCIHQKVCRQQFRKIWKSCQTMFDFFIYAVNMRNTCQLECIYMSPLTNALQAWVKALISDVRSSRYYAVCIHWMHILQCKQALQEYLSPHLWPLSSSLTIIICPVKSFSCILCTTCTRYEVFYFGWITQRIKVHSLMLHILFTCVVLRSKIIISCSIKIPPSSALECCLHRIRLEQVSRTVNESWNNWLKPRNHNFMHRQSSNN